jgi:hypothetical protein
MTRQEIYNQIKQAMGSVPGWMEGMPDSVLDQYWATTKWLMTDTGLSARDKALVAFGAASAVHCPY